MVNSELLICIVTSSDRWGASPGHSRPGGAALGSCPACATARPAAAARRHPPPRPLQPGAWACPGAPLACWPGPLRMRAPPLHAPGASFCCYIHFCFNLIRLQPTSAACTWTERHGRFFGWPGCVTICNSRKCMIGTSLQTLEAWQEAVDSDERVRLCVKCPLCSVNTYRRAGSSASVCDLQLMRGTASRVESGYRNRAAHEGATEAASRSP